MLRPAAIALTWTLAALLAGCGALPQAVEGALPADVLLLGEQHDDAAHQRLHLETVQGLAARGRLAALALEMAQQGASTAGLPREASPEAVQSALRWQEAGWPWPPYAPAVMAAVRAGVPVLGANLPRDRMRAAMGDTSLEGRLPEAAMARQREAIRVGHCDLLPPGQIAPMARIQVARDVAMADTVAAAVQAGRTVVLLAGGAHVDAQLGVPQHLPAAVAARSITWPPSPAQKDPKDYCAELRQQMRGAPAAPASR